MIGFMTWNGPGVHLPRRASREGSAFKSFRKRCDEIGYYMYYTTIQLFQLNVPQYRERLWCFPIRKDVANAIGGIHLLQPEATESPKIGDFLRQDFDYYTVIGPATSIERDHTQVHYEHKPHLIGEITIEEPDGGKIRHSVWDEMGLSPCIRTANRIFIELGEHVVEIALEGLAALQKVYH